MYSKRMSHVKTCFMVIDHKYWPNFKVDLNPENGLIATYVFYQQILQTSEYSEHYREGTIRTVSKAYQ